MIKARRDQTVPMAAQIAQNVRLSVPRFIIISAPRAFKINIASIATEGRKINQAFRSTTRKKKKSQFRIQLVSYIQNGWS